MSTTPAVLAAGDNFILPGTFARALEAELPGRAEIEELLLPWPDVPFGSVAEVNEASGTEDELIAALAGKTALVTQLAPVSERVLEACPQLRFIGVSRGGPTNINVEAARERGVLVVNVPGRNGIATAEMTLGLLLAAFRRIPVAHNTLMNREWRGGFYRHDQVGREVSGSTIGLVGAGAVGSHVATVLSAMGAEVLVHDPYLPAGALDGVVTRVAEVDELFSRADAVSIHARLTPETENLVDASRLGLMRPGSILVNAARGPLVDYGAVADAIESGHLGAAAFDVFPDEPVDMDERILKLARAGHDIVVTPHIAGASTQTAERAAHGVARELRLALDGEAPLHPLTEARPFAAGAAAPVASVDGTPSKTATSTPAEAAR
ncbi:hydroxyacid dehydrogenase [Brevibacterium permense]|uniref:2-hydroxyacid dehydrogenase n=1 Tax=Brevibacterium permense TaxID=234834 RepID=UPI0021D11B0D|nr:2-hydroxyacid dehydrogenase [Brevibacterium permense]MCU4295592.1 hydroxyacid dehydrogenase [Brevibacterium permense]